ncbi:MAG: (Na+)-NQR maturation NqrM [Gammaproteobacteria bacterium]|nr:(Na+)-NQR maturation NqrM [Gammaproteobacteria bacterium]
MTTLLLSLTIFLLVIAGMSIGVMNGRKAISGSCGGLNSSGGCELCTGKGQCRNKNKTAETEN